MTSKNLPGSGSTDHERPTSTAEKEEFSSGGNRHMIILRGKTGLAIDTFVLWLTGYSLMTKQYALANGTGYQPTLLLYTKGAKTGAQRRCGLPYFMVDGCYVVRGSNGGGPTDPHWCHNVRGDSEAKIRVKGRTKHVHAHVSTGEERVALFEKLDGMSRSTSQYQQMCAPRELPLVVLREV
ncbi:MAG: nitroreductase/quinone reductase family protein [Myxococcota bacterium]|jgi:deazaflavin-dependent oxidoreductase (nitroreductase family)|nr:nitroreductase family deazaflavin-dependent oxidoreductase [Myxococcota bacterium]|tara:strand:+ start:495 stop:1037 length:543 start_codon:yes stop_codon:yes gene_type:complete